MPLRFARARRGPEGQITSTTEESHHIRSTTCGRFFWSFSVRSSCYPLGLMCTFMRSSVQLLMFSTLSFCQMEGRELRFTCQLLQFPKPWPCTLSTVQQFSADFDPNFSVDGSNHSSTAAPASVFFSVIPRAVLFSRPLCYSLSRL